MPSTSKSTSNGRRSRIAWSRELKLCLHLLNTEFDIPRLQRVEVFNIVFERYLTSCGLSNGTTSNTIQCQYAERFKSAARDWTSICQPPATTQDSENRQALKARINDALATLESRNIPRSTSPTQRHGNNGRRRSRGTVTVTNVTPTTRSGFHETVAEAAYYPPSTPERVIQPSAVVVIPRSPTNIRAAQLPTPSKSRSPRTVQPATPKIAYKRNDGSTILVSPRAFKAIEKRVQPVPEWKAHPPLPGLLFRYWHEDPDCDRDSRSGFQARKYHRANVTPHIPPNSRTIDPVDVLNHMDRKMEKTPFISTSSRLIWILQLLVKGLKNGSETGRLSVIDASALDQRTVFHARPFHDAVKKTHAFSNGAWHYPGTYEFLVWRKIPRRAIIHTFEAEDFLELAANNNAICAALRLDILRLPRKGLTKTKMPMLNDGSVKLTADITAGLAELCLFFGLNGYSSVEHISHIVSDVVEGWSVSVEYREESEWYRLATAFARHVCKRTVPPVSLIKDLEKVKLAFLKGIEWGCGKVNATHSAALIDQKNRKAAAVGLADPRKIIVDQLDAAKLVVMAHQKTEERRLEKYHQQGHLLPAAPTDDEQLDDGQDDNDVDMDVEDEPTTPMHVDDDETMYYDDGIVLG